MIEDITFNPVDRDVLVSVGDDKLIIGWDLRINTSKTFVVINLLILKNKK